MGRLDCKIIACKNLPNVEMIGTIDPYVVVECVDKTYKTNVADNTQNPKYDETFKFVIADPNSVRISFKVWNSNTLSDDFLGQYDMSLDGLTKGVPKESWHILTQCKGNAEICFQLLAHDFGHEPAQPQAQVQQQAPPPVQQQQAYVPQQPTGFQITPGQFPPGTFNGGQMPMPVGPSAFPGFVPPVPQGYYAQSNGLTHCRVGHALSTTGAYDRQRVTLYCDLCFHECVGNSGAVQCRQCDLDICARCQKVYSRLPPKPKCPQGHDLEPNPSPTGWACDACRGSGSGQGSMKCKRCDFDICANCFSGYISKQWM